MHSLLHNYYRKFNLLRQSLVQPKERALEKPVVLQFPVNDICNSRCQMCNIWQQKKSDEILPDDLRKIMVNPLYSDVRSVGINGGEPTLRKDLSELVQVLFESMPSLENISLITNGYSAEKVSKSINEVGRVVKKFGGLLDVMVSIDGVGELHDIVRGSEGNFEQASKLLEYCKTSSYVSSVRVGCTITKVNIYGLHDLLDWAIEKGVYIKYRLGVPHKRLYKVNDAVHKQIGKTVWLDGNVFDLTFNEKYHICEFLEGLKTHYETSEQQKYFYTSLIHQIMHNGKRLAACDWQHRGATLTHKGELLYCAIQSDILGDVVKDDSYKLYFNNVDHLDGILQNKCDDCTHDYVGIPPFKVVVNQWLQEKIGRHGIFKDGIVRNQLLKGLVASRARYRYSRNKRSIRKKMRSIAQSHQERSLAKKIMICGWYGSETLGDKAILSGIVNILCKYYSAPEIILVSLFPYVSHNTKLQMSELKHVKVVSVDEALNAIPHVDVLLFGGGPVMAINELAEIEGLFYLAKENDVITLLAGCGVGPLGKKYHNTAIKNILALCDRRIYRDNKSLSTVQQFGIDTEKDIVAEDPSLSWISEKSQVLLNEKSNTEKKCLLLGLRDWPFSQYANNMTVTESLKFKVNFENNLLDALGQIIDVYPDIKILPLPMCTNHFGSDDRFYYRKIFKGEFKVSQNIDYSLLSQEMTPDQYLHEFAKADVVLAMRFHSAVFSLGMGIPCVAIDYTCGKGKVMSLANKHNMPVQSIIEFKTEKCVNDIINYLKEPREPIEAGLSKDFGSALKEVLADIDNTTVN